MLRSAQKEPFRVQILIYRSAGQMLRTALVTVVGQPTWVGFVPVQNLCVVGLLLLLEA
mgnify:CR=1 FL=1